MKNMYSTDEFIHSSISTSSNMMKISNKDMKYINVAFDVANKSNMMMRHGCVITCNNKMISTGCNKYRNRYNDGIINNVCSCHAEMDALRNAIRIKTKQSVFNNRRFRKRQRQRRKTKIINDNSSILSYPKKYCFREGWYYDKD